LYKYTNYALWVFFYVQTLDFVAQWVYNKAIETNQSPAERQKDYEVIIMKVYEVTKIVINRRGRLISKETWCIAFNTIAEMNHYMNGKWAMAEDNESYTAVELRA
jgi:hypothetical protein